MWDCPKSKTIESGRMSGASPRSTQRKMVVIWIERILLGSGLALLAIYGLARMDSIFSSQAAIRSLAALDSPAVSVGSDESEDVDPGEIDFSLWDKKRVQDYKESVRKHLRVPLAVLQITKLQLEVPVFNGTDDLTLNRGVGRIPGTGRPGEQGNIGIAGHRDSFFRGLKDIAMGDAIGLRTLKGTDTYRVDRVQIVAPEEVDVLRPRSVPSLTLVTCYPFYFIGSAPQRFIVTASLTREKSVSGDLTLGSLSQTSSSIRRNENE
jgi:sortase A